MTGLMVASVLLVALPLIAVVWAVFGRGFLVAFKDFPDFFVKEIPVIARRAGPGMGPAILGTLLVTGAATLIAVPLGVLGAVYLHEYGVKNRFSRLVRFMATVMTGVPSIVMGLFIYVVWTLTLRLLGVRRLAGAGLSDAAGGDRVDRADAAAGPGSPARGFVRARHHQEPDHPDGGAAGGAARHRLGRAAGGRPGRRRDRAAAVRGRGGHRSSTRTCSPRRTRRCPSRSSATPTSSFVAAQDRAWGAALTLVLLTFVITLIARVFTARFASQEVVVDVPGGSNRTAGPPSPKPAQPSDKRIEVDRAVDRRCRQPDQRRGRVRSRQPRGVLRRFRAVRGVTLKIFKNEITAFIGPSGCGKTTVLRCLNRMHDVTPGARVAGRLRYHTADLYGPEVSATEVRRRIGMVFQKPNPFPKSIYDNVAFGPRVNGVTPQGRARRHRREVAESAALWDEVKDRLRASALGLSGGQQQRLCIARTIAVGPEVVLMDEPCSALDPIATARIEELMRELKSHFTIVIVTHNMQQAGRGQRPHRLLHHRGRRQQRPPHRHAGRIRRDRRRSSRTPATSGPRTTSPAASAELADGAA